MSGKTNTITHEPANDVLNNQLGLVSIMVTMIMMLVISLIVLGFAQVTRHNQAQSLDSQLSSQAYYAAESGVNDAIAKLHDPANANATFNNTNCTGAGSFIGTQSLNSTLSSNVSYSCLLVNNTPSSLVWQSITNGRAVAAPLNTNAPLSSLKLTWNASGTQTNAASCSTGTQQLPPSSGAGAWGCSYGLLRLDLMQDPGVGNTVAAANNTLTFYLKPASSTTTQTVSSFSLANRAYLVNTGCVAATAKCTATINLPASGTPTYYARISAVYNDLKNVTLTGTAGGPATFRGAEAIVDATGKAQDVLRRIQVYVPLSNGGSQAAAAVQTSGSICKLIIVTSPTASDTCAGGPTTGGDPTAPTTPPSNPNGDAHFGNCPNNPGCPPVGGSGSGPTVLSWYTNFVNTSANAPADVKSCTWSWGDGPEGDADPIVTGSPTNSADACLSGQTIAHSFAPRILTGTVKTCYHYQVVLTVYLTNGTSKQYSQSISKPFGTSAPPGCGT